MKLLEAESIITQSSGSSSETIYLTNFRVVQEKVSGVNSKVISINLPSVTSCELRSKSRLIWLVLGFIMGIGVFIMTNEPVIAIGGLLVGIVLFFLTRYSIIYIASPMSTISFQVTGLPKEACVRFLDQVEDARNKSRH